MSSMRRFWLNRLEDDTGISGTGAIAEGVCFTDGTAAMRWLTRHSSWCIYGSMVELEAIHGHGGATLIEWLDPKVV